MNSEQWRMKNEKWIAKPANTESWVCMIHTNNKQQFKYYNDMKKLLLLALSFGLLISCKKDDENGIPPVNPDKPQIEKPQDKPATAL